MRDVDIRRCLRAEMDRRHQADPGALILDEVGLCQGSARIDLAVVNGTIHGYEIKSEKDTLARLPAQSAIYTRALDFVTVVGSANHIAKLKEQVPHWWGLWSACPSKQGLTLKQIRKARLNPSIDLIAVAALLWREEALEELERRGLAKGLRSKPRQELWSKLANSLTQDELRLTVRERLKSRTRWRVSSLPASDDGWFPPCAK